LDYTEVLDEHEKGRVYLLFVVLGKDIISLRDILAIGNVAHQYENSAPTAQAQESGNKWWHAPLSRDSSSQASFKVEPGS
jgi:hypothetical protein